MLARESVLGVDEVERGVAADPQHGELSEEHGRFEPQQFDEELCGLLPVMSSDDVMVEHRHGFPKRLIGAEVLTDPCVLHSARTDTAEVGGGRAAVAARDLAPLGGGT